MSLEGKVALVTGASRGIGRAIAVALGKSGAIVAGTATTEAGANKITEGFKDDGITGQGFVLDVSSDESVKSLATSIQEILGTPQIIVNNAGITDDTLFLRMKDEQWSGVISTNLDSVFRVCKAFVRGMTKARWGRIINVGSIVASRGSAGQANYAAAKAGMEGMSRSLAAELAARNITVNVVAPGFIDTDMTKELPDNVKDTYIQAIPLSRLGKPEDIANSVQFLASDAGEYITGQVLHVNGGMYMN